MPETPSPGEVCYAAYSGAFSPRWLPKEPLYPWSALPSDTQAAWEAAAQAVRAGGTMSDTPITDQLKDILLLVGTILHHGTQQDLDKLHLWLADYAEVITARHTPQGDPHA